MSDNKSTSLNRIRIRFDVNIALLQPSFQKCWICVQPNWTVKDLLETISQIHLHSSTIDSMGIFLKGYAVHPTVNVRIVLL